MRKQRKKLAAAAIAAVLAVYGPLGAGTQAFAEETAAETTAAQTEENREETQEETLDPAMAQAGGVSQVITVGEGETVAAGTESAEEAAETEGTKEKQESEKDSETTEGKPQEEPAEESGEPGAEDPAVDGSADTETPEEGSLEEKIDDPILLAVREKEAAAEEGETGNGWYSFETITWLSPAQRQSLAEIFNYLTEYGFTAEAAAGACGNLFQESGLKADLLTSTGYYGIANWGKGREARLISLANGMGMPWGSMEAQLAMLKDEMDRSYLSRMDRYLETYYGIPGMKEVKNVDAATEAWTSQYEGCVCLSNAGGKSYHTAHNRFCEVAADGREYQHLGKRKDYARKIYLAAVRKRAAVITFEYTPSAPASRQVGEKAELASAAGITKNETQRVAKPRSTGEKLHETARKGEK